MGITVHVKNPNMRWRSGRGYRKSLRFYNAILKYGWDNFEHEIEIVNSKDEAYTREVELIKYYRSRGQSYNISHGGSGSNSFSEETRKKLSTYTPWIKGKHHSDEARRKISEAGMGRKMSEKNKELLKIANHLRPHIVSEEERERISLKLGKPVYQIDKDTGEIIAEFHSTTAAAIAVTGSRNGNHISDVCNGSPHRKTYAGYKWRYKS